MSVPAIDGRNPLLAFRGSARGPAYWSIGLTVAFAIGVSLPGVVFFSSPAAYVPLHLVLEFLSMAISLMVFALAWILRHLENNSQIMVIGLFSLAVLLIDLAHTLSYSGMPDLVTASSPEKAINFWLAGRLVAAIGFLVVALVPLRHWSRRIWLPAITLVVAGAAAVWWIGLYHADSLPRTFVTGEGLTSFKVASDYALSATYAVAALLLVLRARRERSTDMAWLAAAAWTLTLAELFISRYANVTDTFNLLGHLFKVTAYLMVYRAIFSAGVLDPYRRLGQERLLLRSLIDSDPDLIAFTDRDGRYLGANRAFTETSGVPESGIIGSQEGELAQSDAGGRDARRAAGALAPGETLRFEEWIPTAEGGALFDTVLTPYYAPDGERLGVIEVSRDVTSIRQADERIHQLALYDQLTGLPNRPMFSDLVNGSIRDSAPEERPLAVILLDIDVFKTINETLGHRVGDLILQETGRRVAAALGPECTVARFGGDEFSALLPNAQPDAATVAVTKLKERLDEPFLIEGHELTLTASLGVAMYPSDGSDFEVLAGCADAAMYRAKREGHNTYRFYSRDMRQETVQRMQLVAGLRRAADDDELRLHYQPQVALNDGRIVGVEALIRWQHPEFGLLQPDAFIDLAESSGLILPIGDWALRTAIHDAVAWTTAGARPITVAVNISAVQFLQHDLPSRISDILADTGFPAELLELEITESVPMRNPENARAMIERLHEIGLRLSIDDFGTGYSSMTYLKRFRVNTIKIDQSFVRDLGLDADEEDRAIVNAIIEVARALNCRTIAEGVETQEQCDYLREHDCDVIQGFLVGRPVPSGQLLPQLLEEASRREQAQPVRETT